MAPTAEAVGWPDIPGAPTTDDVINALMDYDYGPDYRYNDESGVMTNVVPPIRQIIETPVPKVDEDGNEIAGVRSVLLQAPLGTYTSWNPVASGPLQGNEGTLAAGYFPFAMTRADRLASGDPRLSVEGAGTAARRDTTASCGMRHGGMSGRGSCSRRTPID